MTHAVHLETLTPDPPSAPEVSGAVATIARRAADRLRAGHLWVYRSDIEKLECAINAGAKAHIDHSEIAPGSLVTVVDSRRIPHGSALYSSASQIALRLVSNQPGTGRGQYLSDVRTRVRAALRLRSDLAPVSPENNARRLLFSEADNLPGIVADQYNDLILLQLLTQGTAQNDLRAALAEELSTVFPSGRAAIWERTDPKMRELEQIDPAPAEPLFSRALDYATPAPAEAPTEAPTTTVFTLNGLRFHYDAGSGQKTGAFLDQRLNYAAAARHAHGRALDICTYQGGFALHLARTCHRVTGVDTSRAALEVADRNLALNTEDPIPTGTAIPQELHAEVDWIEADAFDLLRDFEAAGELYNTVVLDPPAFAKSKRAVEGAMRGYKELNLRSIKMLAPGGTLVTCSCSHHVSLEDFTAMLASASLDAGRRLQILETRGAAPDHPAILSLPETSYLKCLICRVA